MRHLPGDNLAYPVLISVPPHSGSGFYLNTGAAVFLVTARHVQIDPNTENLLNAQATLTSLSKNLAEKKRHVLTLDLPALLASQELRSDPAKDIAAVRIGEPVPISGGSSWTLTSVPGVATTVRTSAGVVAVSMAVVRLYADVLESNETYIFGYPSSLGISNIPQIDYTRPLLRRGTVAGKNDARRIIVIDCPAYPGNSGGPVMEVEQDTVTHYSCYIIGVVLEFVPSLQNGVVANSGYTVVAEMDDVMALVNAF